MCGSVNIDSLLQTKLMEKSIDGLKIEKNDKQIKGVLLDFSPKKEKKTTFR